MSQSSGYLAVFKSKWFNKLPYRFKLLFKFILFILFIIILLGWKNISFFYFYYFKLTSIGLCLLVILHDLVYLYFLYLFSKRNFIISDFLPLFLQKWLKQFEIMNESKDSLDGFKELFYRNISVYFIIILMIIIVY